MLKRGLLFVFLILLIISFVNGEKQGDFDNNGCVDSGDSAALQGSFGKQQGQEGYDAKYDLDGNGAVDFTDFVQHSQLLSQDSGCVPGTSTTTSTSTTTTTLLEPVIEETTTTLQTLKVDFNLDGCVAYDDFVQFASNFGGSNNIYDFDLSGQVDFPDFVQFARDYGKGSCNGKDLREIDSSQLGATTTTLNQVKQLVKVPSTPVLNYELSNDEVILIWIRSELIDEELTGQIVLNKISGSLSLNRITGNVGFIDSIVSFFRKILGLGPRAADVRGGGLLNYNIYRNGNNIGSLNDDECNVNCEYKNKPGDGIFTYKIEACSGNICKQSNEVQVNVASSKPAVEETTTTIPETTTTLLVTTTLPETTTTLKGMKKGDFNSDGCVDGGDGASLNLHFNTAQGQEGYDAVYDLNSDGKIDFTDFTQHATLISQDTGCVPITTSSTTSSTSTTLFTKVNRINEYYDNTESSCPAGSVSVLCDKINSCVDCGGECIESGQVLQGYTGANSVYNNQFGCFEGKWDGCNSKDDLESLRPGILGKNTFLCVQTSNNHIEWVSCDSNRFKNIYFVKDKPYYCNETGWVITEDKSSLAKPLDTTTTTLVSIKGDFNNDGCVNGTDSNELSINFNKAKGQEGYDVKYDLNNDEKIDFTDFTQHAQLISQDTKCNPITTTTIAGKPAVNETTTTTSTTSSTTTTTLVNNKPSLEILSPVSNAELNYKNPVVLSVEAEDKDNDLLGYEFSIMKDKELVFASEFDGANQEILFNKEEAGSYVLKVIVSDGKEITEREVSFSIVEEKEAPKGDIVVLKDIKIEKINNETVRLGWISVGKDTRITGGIIYDLFTGFGIFDFLSPSKTAYEVEKNNESIALLLEEETCNENLCSFEDDYASNNSYRMRVCIVKGESKECGQYSDYVKLFEGPFNFENVCGKTYETMLDEYNKAEDKISYWNEVIVICCGDLLSKDDVDLLALNSCKGVGLIEN